MSGSYSIRIQPENVMLVSVALTAVTLLFSPSSAAQRLDRLVALAHLDAAVRYFHPSVATNAARWDSLFAANVVAIADAPDRAEYQRRIAGLMLALGDTSVQSGSPQRTLTYNGFPSPAFAGSGGYRLEWKRADAPVTYRVEMGEDAHADVRLSSGAPDAAVPTVSPAPTSPAWRASYPSAGHRVLGAMRVWSTLRLFNPYQRLITESWDDQLRVALPIAEQAHDGVEYARAIASFAAHVHDTHVTVSGDALRFVVPTTPIGVQARLIENQLVVTRIVDPAAARAGLRLGDVVMSVDGEAIDARIARLTPFISAATPQALRYRLQSSLLRGSDTTPARLAVRGATGGARTVTVRRSPEFNQGLAKHRSSSLIRLLPGNIGYIDLERLPVQMVDSAFRVLAGTKAIILDDRGYPLGTAWWIAPRLNVRGGDSVVAAKFRRLIVSSPDTGRTTVFEFDQPIPAAGGVAKYAGRTVMLIDERTLSQAEHTGLFFEAANGTVFIGSPTMGSNGDVTSFMIPGGITITFTGHDVRHADGRQLQRVGLQPVLAVLPTIAGIRAGRDEVLEQAHRFLGGSGEIPRDTVDVPFVPSPPRPVSASVLPPEPMPSGWMRMGMSGYRVGLDRSVGRSGGASGHVTAEPETLDAFGSLSQIIRADDYRGKRVRFSAYVKTRDVSGRGVGLWMRVDGNGGTMAFDNMQSRPLLGSVDWTQASVVLDVPNEAEGILFGVILASGGEVWMDDASLEVVAADVASTNTMAASADASKVAQQRAFFANRPRSPVNLHFDP